MKKHSTEYQKITNEELVNLLLEFDPFNPGKRSKLCDEFKRRKLNQHDIEEYVRDFNVKNIKKTIMLPDMPEDKIRAALKEGARFVVFEFCFSIVFWTFLLPSNSYLIKPGESTLQHSGLYSLASFFLGWWAIPLGPIRTISTIIKNFRGGEDVTDQIAYLLSEFQLMKSDQFLIKCVIH